MKAKEINEVLSLRQKTQFKKRSDLDTKRFVTMVKDEWDVESLELMKKMIDKRIEFLTELRNVINPRTKVKGFKRY